MLTQLHIRNIAVIQKATIEFGAGLNVFTGETGAGKTILLSAIDAVLGERTSRDIIRTGEDKAFVSALFEDIPQRARRILEEHGYGSEDGTALISREMTESGKNICKINGMPATAAILREISAPLIHIHGQRDSLQLLAPERHMELVDAFGDYGGLLARYAAEYGVLCEIRRELSALQIDDRQKEQRMDMLRFQINEIEAAQLEGDNEEEELRARRAIIRNSGKILEAMAEAYGALRGSEGSAGGILEFFDALQDGVSSASQYMEELAPMAQRIEEIGYELQEYTADLRDRLDSFEFDPRELDEIEGRLDLLRRLQKKYGATIAAVRTYYGDAVRELEEISTSEQRLAELTRREQEQNAAVRGLGKELTKCRLTAAEEFLSQVERELVFLDMPSVRLHVQSEEKLPAPDGMDELAFYVVTNVGEAAKPLSKIASGGEISRIMLAIKNVLAHRDDVGTLIFDEVDTGVSGRAAQKIGHKLSQAAKSRQVICVTHLSQVAAFADTHMLIYKEVLDDRTFTQIDILDDDARMRELARITSGDTITEAALRSAREMMERSRKEPE